jgi:hypothetical protein
VIARVFRLLRVVFRLSLNEPALQQALEMGAGA